MDIFIIFGAKYLVYILILAAAIHILMQDKPRRREMLLLAMVTLPVSYMIAKISSALYYNPRPFVVGQFAPLIAHAADNGFPSDHALLSGAIAAAIMPFNKKVGMVLFALAAIIGSCRVLAGVHHAADIIGSFIIASLVSYVVYKLFMRQKGAAA